MAQDRVAVLNFPCIRRDSLAAVGRPSWHHHGHFHARKFLLGLAWLSMFRENIDFLTVMFVFPSMIRPASTSFCTIAEFLLLLAPTSAHDPAVVDIPRSAALTKQSFPVVRMRSQTFRTETGARNCFAPSTQQVSRVACCARGLRASLRLAWQLSR